MALSSQKRFYLLFLSSLLVFLICSIISAPGPEVTQFSASPKKLLRRFLEHSPQPKKQRLLQDQPSETVIGVFDTFANTPKFLKVEVFEILVKDDMVVTCYLSGLCNFTQTIQIDDTDAYTPEVEVLNAPQLVEIWQSLSLLNVLVLEKAVVFSDDMKQVFLDLQTLAQGILGFKQVLIDDLQNFLDSIVQLVLEQLSNLSTQILLDLTDFNSDLSLEFQNLLANSFSIIVGEYLQQIASDFQYFDNTLTNTMIAIQSDISINSVVLANYIPRQEILDNIENVRQNYSAMCNEFILEFNEYVAVQMNWTDIIEEQIKLQIIDKFNFPSENITVAVQNFLLVIIEDKRNLINDTGSLILQQLNQYMGTLTQHMTTDNQTMQIALQQLSDALNQNQNPQSDAPINSIFTDDTLIVSLFEVQSSINPLGTLYTLTAAEFAVVLSEFQDYFIQYITNLPEIIQIITTTFLQYYEELIVEIDGIQAEIVNNYTQLVGILWADIDKAANVSADIIADLSSDNYTLNEQENQDYLSFNVFNDTIAPTVLYLQSNLQEIITIAENVGYLLSELDEAINFTFNSSSLLTQEILDNVTALINTVEQERTNDIQQYIALITNIQSYLNLTQTTNSTVFLYELYDIVDYNYKITVQIVNAILTNDFTKITLLNGDVVIGIIDKWNASFTSFWGNLTDHPLEYYENYTSNILNFTGDGLQSNIDLYFEYYHAITGFYFVKNNGTFFYFDFTIVPYVQLHINVISTFQELYLLREVLTTSIDLINGTFPISCHRIFEGNNQTYRAYLLEVIDMNLLNLYIEQDILLFLTHNETNIDPVITTQTASLGPVSQLLDTTVNL